MIEVDGLTKKYGDKTAVDGLSFTVEPGIVTGFLGPNGAGKSTTMRVIAGLDAPTCGTVRVNGESYQAATAPMAELGIMLEARAVHTGRSARNHLLALAQTNGVPAKRVSEVIDMVGLAEVAGKRVGGFSLGMGQRLGVAAALLGDPRTVVLDEPVNGLDPEGVLWIRHLLKIAGRRGPDRVHLLAPDERDGADRAAPDHRGAGAADRRHDGRPLHRAGLRQRDPCPLAASARPVRTPVRRDSDGREPER